MTERDLFAPVTMGTMRLSNRIAMAPLTRSRTGSRGVPGPMNAEYYRQRATAGLIVSEATQISQQGQGYAYTPGIYRPDQVAGWKLVTDAVHEEGGHIVCQLWHVGRVSHPSLQADGGLPVSASAIRLSSGQAFTESGFQPFVTPRALRTDEMAGVVADYAHATACAFGAGFDGVEVHAANGYLIEQFLRTGSNHRTDQYGGSIENRVRFLDEVCAAVTHVAAGRPVGIRLSPLSPGNDMTDLNPALTFAAAVAAVERHRLVYMHFIEGATQGPREVPGGFDLQTLRHGFSGLYIANNGFDLDLAVTAVRTGHADMVAFGRPFLSNPDLVARLRAGSALAPSDDKSLWYGGGEHGYTDWPTMEQARAA